MSLLRKTALWLTIAITIGTAGWFIVVPVYLACVFVSASPWLLAEFRSPTDQGIAQFAIESNLAGSSTYFFVVDPIALRGHPRRIGGPYVSDGPVKMERAVWSRDGSVVAVRVGVGEASGKGFERYDGSYWINAYDFRGHRAVSEGATIPARSKAIQRMLDNRGGAGPKTMASPSQDAKSIDWNELAHYDTSGEDRELDVRKL